MAKKTTGQNQLGQNHKDDSDNALGPKGALGVGLPEGEEGGAFGEGLPPQTPLERYTASCRKSHFLYHRQSKRILPDRSREYDNLIPCLQTSASRPGHLYSLQATFV